MAFLFNLKSWNDCQWKWHWWCVLINLDYNYTKHLGKGAAWITNWVLTIDSVIDSVINSFYVLVKDFNTFVHDHNLDCQR